MVEIRVDTAKKVNGEYALFVSFPYDQKIVSIIREFPSRYWDGDNKVWEVPLNKLGTLVNNMQDRDIEITGKYVSLIKKQVGMPANFKFKTKPFAHQIDGFNYGLNNDKWLLGDEMGLGKTKEVIDIAVAKKLQYGFEHCLIVCGVNSLKWNWVNEIHTHSDEDAYIIGQRTKNGKVAVSSNADKLSDLDTLVSDSKALSAYFLITNVESLRDEKIVAKIVSLVKSGKIGLVAVDEAHKCKNPQASQTKGLLKIQPQFRIAMTGTPIMNQPLDLYVILKWLGYEKHSFYAFKNHYCEMGGFGGYEILGYKNMDELHAQLDEIMLRRLKRDVLDLPEKTYIEELVEMTPKQEIIYREVSADIKANIDQIKASSNPLAELIRMRQATGYTGILSSTIQESAKLDRMEELVEEAVENGKKVVIFSNWSQMTDAIVDRLHIKGYYPAVITGQITDAFRQEQVNKFQNDDKCKVIVGTIGAMGTGITLTAGTVEIFMDEPWNRANKEQAEDRCHRAGTTENVTIYTLICKNTIDERIHELVYKKGAIADALVDGINKVDRSELVDFLLN